MEIIGYKCFNKGLLTNNNLKIEINMIYHCNDDISFGKNGFHFCLNLEDTLRYFDAFNESVDITIVKGFGNIISYNETYIFLNNKFYIN